jgi:hypothetical protein
VVCGARADFNSIRDHRLPRQEGFFALDTPAVATKTAIAADDAVAGDHDGEGVGRAGVGDGANGARAADFLGDGSVGAGFTCRDRLERVPDPMLERGRGDIEGDAGDGLFAAYCFDDGVDPIFVLAVAIVNLR